MSAVGRAIAGTAVCAGATLGAAGTEAWIGNVYQDQVVECAQLTAPDQREICMDAAKRTDDIAGALGYLAWGSGAATIFYGYLAYKGTRGELGVSGLAQDAYDINEARRRGLAKDQPGTTPEGTADSEA